MEQKHKNILRTCHRLKIKNDALLQEIAQKTFKEFLLDEPRDALKKRKRIIDKCNASRTTKTFDYKKKLTPLYPVIVEKNLSHQCVRNYAFSGPRTLKCCFPKLEIMDKLGKKTLATKYNQVVDSILAEAIHEFIEIIHGVSVNTKTRPLGGEESHFKIPNFPFLGKTPRYHIYLNNRKELLKRWKLHHPLIRTILNECVTCLPDVLFDLGEKSNEPIELSQLNTKFIKYIHDSKMLFKDLFSRVCLLVKKDKSKGTNHLKTCTGLFAVHVSQAIMNTIRYIVDVTGSENRIPYLKLTLTLEDGLVIIPSMEDVVNLYSNFIRMLPTAANTFLPLEHVRMLCIDDSYISLNVIEEFLEDSISEMTKNIQYFYEPIFEYMRYVDSEFGGMYAESGSEEGSMNFATGSQKITTCLGYIEKASTTLESQYFAIGQLILLEYVINMKTCLQNFIDKILAEISLEHRRENEDICECFQQIKIRALEVPANTEELIKQGKYMIWVKTVHINELKERIQEMLYNLTKLISFGEMSTGHMELNADTVNWLKNIEPILDQNSIMYEQIKFEAEEKLQKTIEAIYKGLHDLIPYLVILDEMDDITHVREYIHKITKFIVIMRDIQKQIVWCNAEEACLGFAISQFQLFTNVANHLYPFYHLLKLCLDLERKLGVWMYGQFEFLNAEEAEMLIESFQKEFLKIQKGYRLKLRQQDETGLKFDGIVDDTDMHNWPAPIKLTSKAIQNIKDFRPALIMMKIMCNDALLKRHWKEMSEIAGVDMTPNAGTSLKKLMDMDLEADIDKYEVISSAATKERDLLRNLNKMQAEWKDICFKTGTYKDTGINILTQLDDIQVVLDDQILKTLTMRGSVFVKPYETEVRQFYDKLIRINSTIDEWGKVQSQWLYLLPIFSSKDIVSQMPEEGMLFKEVNDTYKRYMDVVVRDPRVMETAGGPGVLEAMIHCIELLEQINDGVVNYLEKKRLFFPRFFFLSNDEMLEILSETKDPLRVQPHLKKCFEAISKLKFDDKLQIHAMYSDEGEMIDFVDMIKPKEFGGSVEKWLILVEEQMVKSVKEQILKSFKNYFLISRNDWVQNWPGQVVLAVSQIHWTTHVHRALNNEDGITIQDFAKSLRTQLTDIVSLIRDPRLTNLSRITIKALIVIDVHAKDVVQDLSDKNVRNDKEFKWLAQMRYYLENDDCLVRLVNATVKYAYEYLGNTDRLVITPLTDRCYRTLIGAYHLHLNGAPEGPAGTGKTETTKDLAKAIAVQCVVFNCSDGLDYKAMGKFFKGLASCGAWACFDEFNRIDIEVLSVVAQQILSIVMAVRQNLSKFLFEGTELSLNPACYVCITMNPGYAGRSELPDNLKVLFRTVAMMVPDYAMIGEISLYSYGFIDARNLSVKIVTVYRLCSEQLSSQNHYDYGMRAVKSVLTAAGNNKRNFPNEKEDRLLLRAILDVNLPKFLNHDLPLFDGIISDLFPGVILQEADYKLLTDVMKKCCTKHNLQPKDSFLLKIIQTYEMMIVRWGFMIVGEPFAGKTSTLKILADTLTYINQKGLGEAVVHYTILNPKAITMGQLYGQFDPISYEWSDGVVATCFRNYANDLRPDRKWIIFDGPVDAVWIENMNSVLDDNKKLCLMSGEVMTLSSTMSLIFEVMDLEQASPATVSRCGMIYMEAITLGWEPFLNSWIVKCNPEWCEPYKEQILTMFHWIVPPCLIFLRKNCIQYCNVGNISLVNSMMQLVEMYLNTAFKHMTKKEEELKYLYIWMHATFIQAGLWGLGSVLDTNSKIKFDNFYKMLWKNQLEDHPYPETIEKLEFVIPTEGTLYDYSYWYHLKGNWKYWPDIVKNERVDECHNIVQALIPTVDTARYMALIDIHIQNNKKILLVGPTGTGKSFYFQDLLMNQLSTDLYEPAFITFTVKISANQTQNLVISKLNKLKRSHYGATKGKTCVIFIDDLNMPVKETYGAQPPMELLRQYFDHKNWYDLKTTEPVYLHNIIFLAAMGLVGGSRQDIYPRFLRHFNIFSINEFSDETMSKIYTNILLLGWKNNGFPSDVMMTVQQTVAAGLDIYKLAIDNLRPTPSKSHYVFNLRDFSRLIQGCAMLRKESAEHKTVFIKIWVHEVFRIFYDRLVEQDDKKWLFNQIKLLVRDHFKEHFDKVFEDLPRDSDGTITLDSMKKLMFGTYFDQDSDEDRRYEETVSIQQFRNVAQQCLDEYNATHKTKMDVVLFDYALEHLSKICRVLSMSCGSSLLVGISGSGRQSLTRLASEIYGQVLFQPEITNNYGINEWRDDIKKILKECGGRGRHCVFLITEGQIKEESFLQDIDCLLNSGEVPNMYQIDEKQEILDMVRLAAQGGNRNLDISALSIFYFFTKRCRERLHNILCFSPVGSTFRNRLRLFPSLINCCTIDWFDDWPENALEEVAHNWMSDVNIEDTVKHSAVKACKYFHVEARKVSDEFYKNAARKTYITSASYLELIKSFTVLTNTKQNEILTAQRRYLGGLTKLAFAAEQIAEMQKNLGQLRPQLQLMNAKAIAMMKQIEKETIEVERASALVKEDEKVANKQAVAAQQLKKECEADLAEAIPILEEAISALDTLKPADITLVKSMKNPPGAIKLVMAAVCIMQDIKPARVPDPSTGRMNLDFWGPSVKLLGDMNFLQLLKEYDKDHIKPEIMAKIRKEYLPNADFKPHIVAKASSAAEGLCKWIIAMDKYDAINKIVAPKKAKLEAAEREFAETMEILHQKKEQVAQLEAKLELLNQQLEEAVRKQEELQDSVELCNSKLVRAQKLIGGLGGEKDRWTAAANALQIQHDHLPGDILISSGIMSYLAPFTMQYRQKTVNSWHKCVKELNIPCSSEYNFCDVLGSDVKVQNWYISGLPRDNFSTENGIIQDNSMKWSLFIDPQCQASNWIKKMEKKNSLVSVKFSHSDYMKKIEHCIQMGYPVLVENIAEILEAPLDPLLYKKTFKQAGLLVISLGENVIQYNKNFRLYLTSPLRNPHYLPEVFNRVTIINMALTLEGLQDQLLGIVVAVEKPELQRLKEELIIQKAENRAALDQVETNILKTLSECKGDILEDESAIQILDESKLLSVTIHEKQAKSLEIEKTIEEFRVMYKGVSEHSAVLYYCICDLGNVDPMYQYSLEWFINLYIGSIQRAEKFKQIEKRCESLINNFTFDLYSNITRSLFEKDKLLFSFLLCSKILISRKMLDENEFMFLLTGGLNIENPLKNPVAWLPIQSWDEICRVEQLPGFPKFRESFVQNEKLWRTIYNDPKPEKCTLPAPWQDKLDRFRKLIVIRILRPDKLLVAAIDYISEEMGVKYITPPQFNIAVSYNESYNLCPLIFILSPGTDPMAALVKFAEEKNFNEKFQSISLGQGQGPRAAALIQQGQEEGLWVCLQNCHLATSWMPSLEKIFEDMDFTNTNDNFRLWLTSYPSAQFPVSILQKGVKITNEPPTGLKENLLKSYVNDPVKNPDFYSGCPGKEEMFSRLLYGVAFFHAVVQERRTYGALGWNIPYGFNDSDFDISVQQLQIFINESEDPFEALSYLIGECNYGGRVTDDWDRRLITTILEDFLNTSIVTLNTYSFSDAADCYGLPSKNTYECYVAHIQGLPQIHPPQVFGLNTNAGITKDLKNSNQLLNSILKAYGEIKSGGTGETDKQIMLICSDMLSKLPNTFDQEKAIQKFPVQYSESMNTVLVQEMDRFNRLLVVIRNSLITMQKAVQGLVAMSPALEDFSSALLIARVPASWAKASYPSLKNLPNYLADFLARIEFLDKWFQEGKPSDYWVSGFYFTQAFLTGVKQNYARRYTIPIDQLTFDFEIMKQDRSKKPPNDGAYIYGLFMDGARYDRDKGQLDELLPKILYDSVPLIWLQPIKNKDYDEKGRYRCPVYKTSERKGVLSTTGHSTNYVLPILVNTGVKPAHWIKRSVAMLCQLD